MSKKLVGAAIVLLGIGSVLAMATVFRDKEAIDYLYGNQVDSLRFGVQTNVNLVPYVEMGGLGEVVSLDVQVTTSNGDWERLSDIEDLQFSAQPSLFQVTINLPNGEPIICKASEIRFGQSRCNGGGSTWSYGIDIPLHTFVSPDTSGPHKLDLSVTLNREVLANVLSRKVADGVQLESGNVGITLNPLKYETTSFTQRLLSLRSELTADEVQRIMGSPKARRPVLDAVRDDWPSYDTLWEYENPDYDDSVPVERRKVTLYFDANNRLINYAQSIYGC